MLQRVVDLSYAAGGAILQHYDAGVSAPSGVTLKPDDSPVTEADREANDLILDGLACLAPRVPVISEESVVVPYEQRRAWKRFWLVDPLDGTKEFLRRNGEFTVNIALIDEGQPVLGVVYAPALDVMYFAARGQGAFRATSREPAERIHSAAPAAGDSVRVVVSRSHGSASHALSLLGRRVSEAVPMGSSLKFCLVAEGRVHAYPREGPTMEWDVAAGDCIYRYSGRDGERQSTLRYNKPSLRNEGFVVGLDH